MSDADANDEGADVRGAGIGGDLSAGLRALAERGVELPLVDQHSGYSGVELRASRSELPLPSLSRPLVEAHRRPPAPAGLVEADRILAAAGRRPAAVAPTRPVVPERVPPPPEGNMAGSTLLPRAATIESPARERFVLADGDQLVIGRAPGRDGLSVDHLEVSRSHVRVEVRLGQLLATDLGSTNGTSIVSGASIRDLDAFVSAPLAEGDRLVVSGDVILCSVVHLGVGR